MVTCGRLDKNRAYGTPFVTKLKISYGHDVSELRREKKGKEDKKRTTVFLGPIPNPNPNPIPLAH